MKGIDLDELFAKWDEARWSVACREMAIRIAHRHFEAAHQVLNFHCAQTSPGFATPDTHVATVVSIRNANALEAAGYSTLRAVDAATNDELLAIPNFGFKALQEVRAVISAMQQGRLQELCPDDMSEFEDLIDESAGYEAKKVIEHLEVNRLGASMNGVNIKAMLDVLDNPQEALSVLDQEIAKVQHELTRLKRVRNILATDSKEKLTRPRSLSPRRKKLEQEIVSMLKSTTDCKLTSKAICDRLGIVAVDLGNLVSASSQLMRIGHTIQLSPIGDA